MGDNEPIETKGFLVFQDAGGLGRWHRFHESEEDALKEARSMVGLNYQLFVVPTVRVTTKSIQQTRGEL